MYISCAIIQVIWVNISYPGLRFPKASKKQKDCRNHWHQWSLWWSTTMLLGNILGHINHRLSAKLGQYRESRKHLL